ncbi:hypothetical protein [Streptomyces cadmiisoli]|uniref:hypothetical protein n=1 Tax=Streptomyces cadmiisoli TaxID=2184053 RepID=UPI0036514EE1
MFNLPYTNDDLRREAARQYAEIVSKPDLLEVGDEMRTRPIASTAGGKPEKATTWTQLSGDEFHDARNEVQELLDDAADVSRWAVDLGACGLRFTSELAWGRGGDAWDLAVQIAHRPGLSNELREAITAAVRGAVNRVLDDRGIDDTRLLHQHTSEEPAS